VNTTGLGPDYVILRSMMPIATTSKTQHEQFVTQRHPDDYGCVCTVPAYFIYYTNNKETDVQVVVGMSVGQRTIRWCF